jgi:hypothetical protein
VPGSDSLSDSDTVPTSSTNDAAEALPLGQEAATEYGVQPTGSSSPLSSVALPLSDTSCTTSGDPTSLKLNKSTYMNAPDADRVVATTAPMTLPVLGRPTTAMPMSLGTGWVLLEVKYHCMAREPRPPTRVWLGATRYRGSGGEVPTNCPGPHRRGVVGSKVPLSLHGGTNNGAEGGVGGGRGGDASKGMAADNQRSKSPERSVCAWRYVGPL